MNLEKNQAVPTPAEKTAEARKMENKKFITNSHPEEIFLKKIDGLAIDLKKKLKNVLGRDLAPDEDVELNNLTDKYKDLLDRESFFATNPPAELAELRQQEYMSEAEIGGRLSGFQEWTEQEGPVGADKELLKEVIGSIDEETEFISKLSETVGLENLLGSLADGEYALPVKFGAKDFPEGGGVRTGKSIFIGGEAPSPTAMLEQLANKGQQIIPIHTVHHELIHNHDDAEKLTAGQIKKLDVALAAGGGLAVALAAILKNDAPAVLYGSSALALGGFAKMMISNRRSSKEGEILTETHAYSGNRRISPELNTLDIAKHLGEYYGFNKASDVEKIFSASEAIQKLYALGLNDKEIGSFVKESTWNKKEKNWKFLEEKINAIMQENNVSPEELGEFMKNQDLRTEIDNWKVKKITQEKIKEATDKLPEKYKKWGSE